MGVDDFREIFIYVVQQLNKCKLGYLYVMDGFVFGFYEWGEFMLLVEFRVFYDGLLIGNCGYIKVDVEQCINDGDVDMIVFGCFWIINLDLFI